MKKLSVLMAAVGAALTYFLDPESGRRRRAVTKDRVAAFFRRGGRRLERTGRGVAAGTGGLAKKVTHLREEEKPQPNDATLASKVESEIFRDPDVPKGQVSVNAENGVVYLRGEVESPDLVSRLEQAAREVKGVRDVENLLHTPGTPAPQNR
ncbi:MAG TPA: BON domain-containing protein [Gaiellaceae bacterium]|nr:BON domain-containing protein [Gaiellaceae bacterium]